MPTCSKEMFRARWTTVVNSQNDVIGHGGLLSLPCSSCHLGLCLSSRGFAASARLAATESRPRDCAGEGLALQQKRMRRSECMASDLVNG